jgi:TctA family transporter
VQFFAPASALITTITVQVYREANYAGTNPQMIIRQPGQADSVITDTGAAAGWNTLTASLTPAGAPGFITVLLVSNNIATSGAYNTYFDSLSIS